MKINKHVKWFLLVSTALGSLTSFAIYNSLKKENDKSIKIDYNKVNSMLNDKGFRKNFLDSNHLGENNPKFDKIVNQNIDSFKKKKYNLNDVVSQSKKLQSRTKYMNLKNYHINSNNGTMTSEQREYLNKSNLFGGIFNNHKTTYSSSNESWDDWADDVRLDWTELSKILTSFEAAAIAVAVLAAACAAGYFALAFFTFGETIGEAIECTTVCAQTGAIAVVVAGVLTIINASINYSDDRYKEVDKINKVFAGVVTGLTVELVDINMLYSASIIPCPAAAISMTASIAVLAAIAALAHKKDEASNYFFMDGVHFNKKDIKNYALNIDGNKNVTLSIDGHKAHVFKENNLSEGLNNYNSLTSMFPHKGQGENFRLHGQSFDLRNVNSFDVQVIDNKNTTLTINDGQKHQFKQNLADSNKDYDYLNSIMLTKGQGENFKFHDHTYDITKVNSYDVQVIDNKNTTLTINDGQKHQFKQNLDDSNKDYDYLNSIMPKQGQGENFKLHGQSFDITKVNSFNIQVIDNKNTTLTINDGQKHQFKQNLDDSNKDYDYLNSIMPKQGQGENFNFHGNSFDLRNVNSFDVQIVDNKNTTLTINDGQKHQFKQNLDDSNKDYDYLNSIMLTKGQGENFKFHGQTFDLRKVTSFDVQVIDNKNTTLTINDGKIHQFKQNLADSNKDYDYLNSIKPKQGQGENFKLHGQTFDLRKVNSFDVQVIDNKNTTLTINEGQKHQFNQNIADANKDYDYLYSIMPTKGQGENFKFHNQTFDITKVNSYDIKVIDNDDNILTINDGQKHQFNQNIADSNKDYDYLYSIMPKQGQGENFKFHGQSFDLRKVTSFDVQVIDNKNTTLTINDGQKHQFKQNLADANKDYDYLNSIMSTKGQGENFNFHGYSFDLRKVNSFDVKVFYSNNTTLTINDGQKYQFKQNLADANKDYDYLNSIMPKQGQGENFYFYGQLFDLRKVTSFDVQVVDKNNTTLTINDGQKHQFKQNLDDSNKDYAFLQSIMPTKGQGEGFKIHGDAYNLEKINYFKVKVIDPNYSILTINDGKIHTYKEKLSQSKSDYAYLSSITKNDGKGINYLDWNLIQSASVLLSITLLIGLLVIGIETERRKRSLINKKHNIKINKPNFEHRNPNLQLKKPSFEYRNSNLKLENKNTKN
ncbi:MAG: hypothetical protein ACRCW6_01230 [Mycoplasmoidaceae bacterium]